MNFEGTQAPDHSTNPMGPLLSAIKFWPVLSVFIFFIFIFSLYKKVRLLYN